jgi:type IV secretory pathway component VirB8
MELDVKKELEEQRKYLEAIYASVEKTRKYFQWTLIISIVVFVLPLLGLMFVLPSFISSYTQLLGY